MTVNYSENSNQKPALCNSKRCKECGLFLNQEPIFDKRKISNVFWVGLSAVQFNEGDDMLPLSILTASGALVHSIESPFLHSSSFYKTNIVKCLPLKNEKIRYPVESEMQKCFPNFEDELRELQPSVVFLLGKQVATFVFKKLGLGTPILDNDFNYNRTRFGSIDFVPVHHPSYILVYKRKQLEAYKSSIQRLIPQSQSNNKQTLRNRLSPSFLQMMQ